MVIYHLILGEWEEVLGFLDAPWVIKEHADSDGWSFICVVYMDRSGLGQEPRTSESDRISFQEASLPSMILQGIWTGVKQAVGLQGKMAPNLVL